MEQIDSNIDKIVLKKNTLSFLGKGSQLFAIDLVNAIFIILSLGFYYPWAKAKKLKYLYQHTSLANSSFDFLGSGKELFRGYIKAIIIMSFFYITIYGGQFAFSYFNENETLLGIYIALLILVILVGIPFFSAYAIYGTFKYRSARSSWRGILCGFKANKSEFIKFYLKGTYLIIGSYALMFGVMLGSAYLAERNGESFEFIPILGMMLILPLSILFFYTLSWFQTKYYHITYGNLGLGDLKLNYKGKTSDLFAIQLLGTLLSSITLGIYYFWFKKDIYNFLVQNLYLVQDDEEHKITTKFTGGGFFKLELVNFLLLISTLGLGYSWIYSRTAKYLINNIIIPENINLDKIQQTEKTYSDATGEELSDIMDMGGIFF